VNAADGAWPSCPVAAWKMPTAVMPRMDAMKMYVGTAKTLPASLMPRRVDERQDHHADGGDDCLPAMERRDGGGEVGGRG
jgi:hypothetical protein